MNEAELTEQLFEQLAEQNKALQQQITALQRQIEELTGEKRRLELLLSVQSQPDRKACVIVETIHREREEASVNQRFHRPKTSQTTNSSSTST
jgi:cell division septum initiation protein DivIVA